MAAHERINVNLQLAELRFEIRTAFRTNLAHPFSLKFSEWSTLLRRIKRCFTHSSIITLSSLWVLRPSSCVALPAGQLTPTMAKTVHSEFYSRAVGSPQEAGKAIGAWTQSLQLTSRSGILRTCPKHTRFLYAYMAWHLDWEASCLFVNHAVVHSKEAYHVGLHTF